jgi:hypothetical protein
MMRLSILMTNVIYRTVRAAVSSVVSNVRTYVRLAFMCMRFVSVSTHSCLERDKNVLMHRMITRNPVSSLWTTQIFLECVHFIALHVFSKACPFWSSGFHIVCDRLQSSVIRILNWFRFASLSKTNGETLKDQTFDDRIPKYFLKDVVFHFSSGWCIKFKAL